MATRIDLQTLGPDWRLVHTDEARWSPMPGHEYSVSAHAPYGAPVWVVSYFEPDARTGVWIEGAGPTDSRYVHAFQAAKAAQQHWSKHRGLRIVNPSESARRAVISRIGEEPQVLDPTPLLKHPDLVPADPSGDPRPIYWFSRNKTWMVWSPASTAAAAQKLGKKLQRDLISKRQLTASDPYLHDGPLVVLYGDTFVELPPLQAKARKKPATKTIRYPIQPSGMEVEGTAVGPYLAIRKPSTRDKRYIIDHVPTGYRMFEYPRQKLARTVAKALDARFGDALDFTDPGEAARLSRIDAELLEWAPLAAQYPTVEDLRAARAQKQAEQDALEQEKRAWEGKWMHWTAGSMRYGEEAKIVRVHEVDPAGTERGPERLKVDLEYSPTRAGHGVELYLDGIEMGRAPAELPWAELRRGREWGARIHNVVFRIAQVSERYLLWTVGPGISESDPPMFGSLTDAEQAAAEFAAQHGRRGNPLSPIKQRLLAY